MKVHSGSNSAARELAELAADHRGSAAQSRRSAFGPSRSFAGFKIETESGPRRLGCTRKVTVRWKHFDRAGVHQFGECLAIKRPASGDGKRQEV